MVQWLPNTNILYYAAQDWELTSARDARSEASMDTHQDTSGTLPTAQEVIAAVDAHSHPNNELSSTLCGSSSVATAAGTNADAAVASADTANASAGAEVASANAAVSEDPVAPASISTTLINELLESGGHTPEPTQQQQ